MAISIYQPPSTNLRGNECGSCGCPTCGGLQCLCRPRFFAGQLLTDETLNQLERYIVEKNKLHNRYLHGWGVVCGLEVVCNPCNAVTVRGGYALSPCGEDVIVCKDVTVDVCSLINQCKDKRRDWECEPYGVGQNTDCKDFEEDWILTVRYDETTSRGITALKGGNAPACCSSCSCGGSSSCGCGGSSSGGGGGGGCGCGGGNGNGKGAHAVAGAGSSVRQSYRPAAATVAAQCEPTLTCEGYVFEVCKPLPEQSASDSIKDAVGLSGKKNGAMIDRFSACILRLMATLPQKPTGANVTKAQLYQWCCQMKQALRDNLFDHPVYNCQLAERLNFACPDPNIATQTVAQYHAILDALVQQVMAVVGAEYIRYCLCSAFLPPCPEEVCDPRVPLATVTVRKDAQGNCRVVRICNLGKRRHVITFPNLGYWLSPVLFPLSKMLRKLLETICCRPWQLPTPQPTPVPGGGSAIPVNPAANESTGSTGQPASTAAAADATQRPLRKVTTKRGFKAFAGQVWANRTRSVTEETLFLGAIGAQDEQGQPYLAQTELANPFFTVMVNRIAGPLLAKLPDDSLEIAKRSGTNLVAAGLDYSKGRSAAGKDAAPATDEIAALKARLSELQKSVEQQSAMIDELRKQVKPKQ